MSGHGRTTRSLESPSALFHYVIHFMKKYRPCNGWCQVGTNRMSVHLCPSYHNLPTSVATVGLPSDSKFALSSWQVWDCDWLYFTNVNNMQDYKVHSWERHSQRHAPFLTLHSQLQLPWERRDSASKGWRFQLNPGLLLQYNDCIRSFVGRLGGWPEFFPTATMKNLGEPRRVVRTVRGPVHERPDVPVGFVWPFCPLPSQLISGFQTFLSCTPIWKTLECLFPYKLDYACWVKPLFNFLLFLGSNPGPYT